MSRPTTRSPDCGISITKSSVRNWYSSSAESVTCPLVCHRLSSACRFRSVMCLTLLFSALSLQCAPGNPGEAAGSDRYGQKMSELEIRPAAAHDAEALIAAEQSAAAREHLRERWAKQCRGEALFLL